MESSRFPGTAGRHTSVPRLRQRGRTNLLQERLWKARDHERPRGWGVGGEGCMTSLQFTDFRQQVPGKALPAQSREERSLGPEGGPEDGMEFSTLITLDSRSATGVSSLHLLPTLQSAANSRPSLTGGPHAHPHSSNSAAPRFLSSLSPPWSSALHKFVLFQVTCHPSTAFLALRQRRLAGHLRPDPMAQHSETPKVRVPTPSPTSPH